MSNFELPVNQIVSDFEIEKRNQYFSTLFQETLKKTINGIPSIEYNLPYPKEDFLNFLVKEKGVLLHGSPQSEIENFEPKQANDSAKLSGNKKAVYAVTDPVLAVFYAIKDRNKIRGVVKSGVTNSLNTGELEYEFSVPKSALDVKPWTRGSVYIFDKNIFYPEKDDKGELSGEWTSEVSIKPIAKLAVEPEDFRFLNKVKAHN